jgi:hypothetical protein
MKSNAAQCCRIVGRKRGFTLAKKYGPRPRKPLVVLVVAACVAIHGQVSPKQMADPAMVALGSGFVSDTARVNGATLHYVRGGAGPAVISLHGFPEDWYAYHRIMPQLAKQFTVVAVDLARHRRLCCVGRWLRRCEYGRKPIPSLGISIFSRRRDCRSNSFRAVRDEGWSSSGV